MSNPEICIVVCTYQRPENLRRSLASIAGQRDVVGKMEVVVADDGSQDETREVFERFRASVDFPVRFVTHPHAGFCPGRCRNEGVAATQAEYLLLLDGDCMIPPDHVRIHLERRRRGIVRIGDCLRLDEASSARITAEMAFSGAYQPLAPWHQRVKMLRKACKAGWYNWRGHPFKPRLTSNNVGLWRDDYVRINGFDESYVGWGCEDDDFGMRLRRCGLRLESILWWTRPYHLWHPTDPSMPARWHQGANVNYLKRGFHLLRCGNGLEKRAPRDLRLQYVGAAPRGDVLGRVLPAKCQLSPYDSARPAEVEVLFAPSARGFSGRADCNLLVVPEAHLEFAPQYSAANVVVSAVPWPTFPSEHQFALHEFGAALHYLLYNARPMAGQRLRAA